MAVVWGQLRGDRMRRTLTCRGAQVYVAVGIESARGYWPDDRTAACLGGAAHRPAGQGAAASPKGSDAARTGSKARKAGTGAKGPGKLARRGRASLERLASPTRARISPAAWKSVSGPAGPMARTIAREGARKRTAIHDDG